jgi:hypothetical protein
MVVYNLSYIKPQGDVLICTFCVMDTHSSPSSNRLSHLHPDLQFVSMTSRLPPLSPPATHSPPLPSLPPLATHSPPLPPFLLSATHSPPHHSLQPSTTHSSSLPLATTCFPLLSTTTTHLPSLRLVTASIPPLPPRPPYPLQRCKPQRHRRPTSSHIVRNGKYSYFFLFCVHVSLFLVPCIM